MEGDERIGEVLVSEEDLQRRVTELAAEVSRDYEGRDLLLVAILKGAVPFLADLMRQLTVPCELDFMAVSSYGSSTDSSGVVRILKDLDASISGPRRADRRGHHRLGADAALPAEEPERARARLARGLRPADQARAAPRGEPDPLRRLRDTRTAFAIGYGLDLDERYRNLSYVAALREDAQDGLTSAGTLARIIRERNFRVIHG